MAFDQTTRNCLQSFVSKARAILSEEFTRQLQATYGLDPNQGTIADIESLSHLDNYQLQTAHILRETVQHYMTTTAGKTQKEQVKLVLERIVREQAFTVLNRLAALRMAEARGFLLESIGSGYSSQGFQLYQMLEDGSHGETGDAYQSYLFSLFDEFGLDLAVLFDRFSVQGRLFPRETALLQLIEQINDYEIEPLWAEDETIGWIYQFWNGRDEIDKMRSASRAPRTSREMAVRNQFFTPRYVVEFLTDNTLGRIWYEMTKGNTTLVDSCQYLVKRPNEVFLVKDEISPIQYESNLNNEADALTQEEILSQPVYIQHRPLKDPRTIRMLDPACGSMHFGLYAFDLFERIYLEAWQIETEQGVDVFEKEMELQSLQSTYGDLDSFKQQIPKLIIEHNIHGVDIDPRAVQIAGLSLWQRAQRAWHEQGVKPNQRPTIVKSNIVCAEPMPGEQDLLKEFTSTLNPPALGQLVEVIFEKMALAGEAGTLLKIEQEIESAISKARQQWDKTKDVNGGIRDLFEEELRAATPQQELGFDLSGIDDETFWEDAEQLILQSLKDYSEQATSAAGEKRLFAEDAAKGFAFIDLSRKRFDVVLMNPPFGDASKNSKKYIDDTYPNSKNNILACFIERGLEMEWKGSKVGTIVSRTCYYLSSMEDFRKLILLESEIDCHVDLGSKVLDAMVEVACTVYTKKLPDNLPKPFIRSLVESNKQEVLFNSIKSIKKVDNLKSVFLVNQNQFNLFSGSPFVYWISNTLAYKVSKYKNLKPDLADIRVGLQTGDDFRFLRLWWEVSSQEMISLENKLLDSDYIRQQYLSEVNRRKNCWCFYSKLDKAAVFYAPLHLLVQWGFNGEQIKAYHEGRGDSPSRYVRSETSYFLPGFSYMLRSTRLIPYVVPRGVIPTAGRSQIYPHVGLEDEALITISSNIASAVARFKGENFGGPKFQNSMVESIPYHKINEHDKSVVLKEINNTYEHNKALYQNDETSINYIGHVKRDEVKEVVISRESLIGRAAEKIVYKNYNVTDEEIPELELDLMECINSTDMQEVIERGNGNLNSMNAFVSWAVGVVFGRFRDAILSSYNLSSEVEVTPFDELGNMSPAMKDINRPNSNRYPDILVSDLGNKKDIAILISDIAERHQIKIDWDINSWLSSGFFDYHLKQYSRSRRQAPIYWPLQTSSGSYTLWVYYHRLSSQTLYSCVNDFVEPKLALVTEDLNALSNNSNRSSIEEKELTKLTDLQNELKDFRDELLRLAKVWKPNLNDGVQITAAPLGKLFQHTAWQKKLKETWEKLEEGEYDWAHLAASMWPERVLRKCHQDRSLAIAHDVEDMFWQEVEVPIMRGKKPTGKTKLEWQPIPASETMLNDMVNEAKARLQ
ncbi:BREX-1 system adenine-specific DNA-methyltransferase PglX [Psychrobacter sp. Ps2]|uniref:BREX-1 system adenine-specific DNA-methyltransferase PglX n=1 Tax=Psychrobacter sp. Ps2 TaxID=2790956 RepID=UPI001EE119BE|nr:BREX-1 system adenine-specific DNA-methyltransferase PglX [Psychrobacter sp. Ps2]MCG3857986.1 BREX-1 system adenine-specific DNA-methyltransferase PglX [Psychrobacter sp. Ps2]